VIGQVSTSDDKRIYLRADFGVRPEIREAVRSYYPIPLDRTHIVGRAILDADVVHVPDIEAPDAAPEGSRAIARMVGYRSALCTPMFRGGRAIGVIVVCRRDPGPFSDEQIRLLRTFADQAVIAIENVRLFKELEARNRELTEALDRQTATSEILRVISDSRTDVQPVFDTIIRNAVRLCGALHGGVYRFDGQLVHSVAHDGYTLEHLQQWRATWPKPLTGPSVACQAIRTRSAVRIGNFETAPELAMITADTIANMRARGSRSVMAVPMFRQNEVIGAISLAHREVDAFSDTHVELLQTFADQAVIAIENARLIKELEERTQELTRSVEQLTALGEVGRAVSSTLDLETVLTTIVSHAVQLSGLDGGVVFEYEEGAQEFVQRVATETGGALAEARRTTRIRKGEGVLGRTAITLEPVQVADIAMPGAYEGRLRQNLLESGIRAILAVPMVCEGRLIGCLGVTRNRPGEFPAATIDLLRTFATQSALAIQNARLFREIEDKSQQLEAASRHKSEFLANMSHELRTPLNAIIGFSEVLAERMFGELNEKQEEYLKDIYASGQHLLSLINDILDLSKIEAGRMELELAEFDLPSAIANALILVRERASRRGITLGRTIDERLGMLHGDERKVKQVLLNLLSNALKFTPEGGRIDVSARMQDGVAEIAVTDTGVGIAPEDQEAIFEEFRQVGTADKKVEGTGLGLALSRKFIELHGGRIWVESTVGQGSTFIFTLPATRTSSSE
jgi:two-component system, NtrC family, sensor kinase